MICNTIIFMLIIIDHKIPQEAKDRLSTFGQLMELKTEGITYPAISGHPDIFFCQTPDQLIVAPNLPQEYLERMKIHDIPFVKGELPVGKDYPSTSRYNIVITDKYLVHNYRNTDPVITKIYHDLIRINVDQGYCRCNLLPLKENHFITSDKGIHKELLRHGLDVLFVSPEGIMLEGFPNGFFGGCCGVWEDKIFIYGNLKYYKEGNKVEAYLSKLGYELIQLFNGPLTDFGSIYFIK